MPMQSDEKKYLTVSYDKITPNTVELQINGESHTLGNMVAEKIQNDPRCLFSAYKVDHPLVESLSLKISADKNTPVLALVKENIKALLDDICCLINQAKEESENV